MGEAPENTWEPVDPAVAEADGNVDLLYSNEAGRAEIRLLVDGHEVDVGFDLGEPEIFQRIHLRLEPGEHVLEFTDGEYNETLEVHVPPDRSVYVAASHWGAREGPDSKRFSMVVGDGQFAYS